MLEEKQPINFSIEGSIEEEYPKGKKAKKSGYFWLFSGLFICAVLLNVYLLYTKAHKSNTLISNVHTNKNHQHQMDSLQLEIKKLENQLGILIPQTQTPKGVFFEVQIGAFENFNLDDYLSEMAELKQEKYDNKNKFLLGRFADLGKALRFENDIKRMGLAGAFIVGRVDGVLTTKDEAIKAQKLR